MEDNEFEDDNDDKSIKKTPNKVATYVNQVRSYCKLLCAFIQKVEPIQVSQPKLPVHYTGGQKVCVFSYNVITVVGT